jgi:hypothetical protein
MTSIVATTGINPFVQPLNTSEEEQRVSNVTRNSNPDNVALRAAEAPDQPAPRNNTPSSTQPQDELNRRDDPRLQPDNLFASLAATSEEPPADTSESQNPVINSFAPQQTAEQRIGVNVDAIA